MLMMALLPPGGLLGGYAADPGGVNGSWEEACTCVSNPIRVRVALAAGEFAHRLPQRRFLGRRRLRRIRYQNGHNFLEDLGIDYLSPKTIHKVRFLSSAEVCSALNRTILGHLSKAFDDEPL